MIYLFGASLYWMAKRIGRKETTMSKPHPSMALTLDLDESIVDHELRLPLIVLWYKGMLYICRKD